MNGKEEILHKRNPHRGQYDFTGLTRSLPELKACIIKTPDGRETIDFSDSRAVLLLNKALLSSFYHVDNWRIPEGYLCPPVPGRADHIHYAADLLGEFSEGLIPRGKETHILDIGTGANCIYPIIGSQSYGWRFTASEIDPLSLKVARLIVQTNRSLGKLIKIKQQKQKQFILRNIIDKTDRFDLTLCNPPFHGSKKEALEANRRKWSNLKGEGDQTNLNFGGMENELWYPGGEKAFVGKMIRESIEFGGQVLWFTTLLSRSENLKPLEESLKGVNASEVRVIPMSQGQKKSRLLAWSFKSTDERKAWLEKKNIRNNR